ncbi:MAG: hypothetical protein ACPG19_13970 [Saprospiraceae bacterium]
MIWGISGEKKLVTENLPTLQCPNCHDIGEVYAIAYCKYLHLVFIPTFSIGKRSKFVCETCQSKVKKKFISAQQQEIAQHLKKSVKIPFTHFIGASIFAILLIIIFSIPSKPAIDPLVKLQTPKLGDIYSVYISEEDDLFSTWKTVNIDEDSIYIFKNKVKIEGEWSFILGKDKESAQMFIPDTIAYTKEEILQMYEEGFITDVDRATLEEEQ